MIPLYPVPCGDEECSDPLDQTKEQAGMILTVLNAALDDMALRLKLQAEALDTVTKKAATYLKLRLTNQFKKLATVTDSLETALSNKIVEQAILLNTVVPGAADVAAKDGTIATLDVAAETVDAPAGNGLSATDTTIGTITPAPPPDKFTPADPYVKVYADEPAQPPEKTLFLTPEIPLGTDTPATGYPAPAQPPAPPPPVPVPPSPSDPGNTGGVPVGGGGGGGSGGGAAAVVPLTPLTPLETCQPAGQWVTVCIQAQLLNPVASQLPTFPDPPVFPAVDASWPALEGDDDEGWYGE